MSNSITEIEVKYNELDMIDVDYYIEQARAERASYVANLFRKAFFKTSEKSGKARVSYNLQQSAAH
ncbi:RSP_7527 family protein [Marinobacterium sp. YM272]|uniref:RSP_7527 family protein n=1 Tax=Marinobacterium sp. YM272 TaxID=3421654 RepID=UPI003D7FA052